MTNTTTTNTAGTAGSTATRTVLVLGGTGKTGRRVADRLRRHDDLTVRIGSRRAEPSFDWTEPAGWAAALAGCDAVYLSYQPDLAVPGSVGDITEFCRQAKLAGVRRIVLLSGRGEPEARACEQVVEQSGIEHTILRCSWFMQNFSEDYLLDGVLAGEVVLPATEVPEPFVDADDIADVAVAALLEDRHKNQLYELTGPRSITFAEAVRETTRATGRKINYITVPLDDYLAQLATYGVPDEVGQLLGYLFGTVLDGRNAEPVDGVRQALGREATSFADFAGRTAGTGVWDEVAR
ncbi:NmrA family transcriptional regulator [Microlunatus elymi]|uniref:NmrA family transcriptional regulator n=1 Tax=Microlunatus elymi TaxID=2596828 RepID=A0A516PXP0_9ACTN|nr:NAD(P)H-binding protein [Microlunatus elymi]QDP95944.1 NmrA family transcriptional regulator [Microlunatus elymi]